MTSPQSSRRQVARFLVVGSITVAIDFVVYRLLLLGVAVTPAKAASFVVASAFAYLLNRSWTFEHAGGPSAAVKFTILYATTLGVNVSVNAISLAALPEIAIRIEIAFLIAQAVSTTINFLALRFVVFR